MIVTNINKIANIIIVVILTTDIIYEDVISESTYYY
jgi:hypothetical protein